MPATETFEISKTEAEWRTLLTPEAFRVLHKHGTERAGSSPLDTECGRGTYLCAGRDLPLSTSETKYDSRTGWPSFSAPIEGAIRTASDRSVFTVLTEVHCRRCGGPEQARPRVHARPKGRKTRWHWAGKADAEVVQLD